MFDVRVALSAAEDERNICREADNYSGIHNKRQLMIGNKRQDQPRMHVGVSNSGPRLSYSPRYE